MTREGIEVISSANEPQSHKLPVDTDEMPETIGDRRDRRALSFSDADVTHAGGGWPMTVIRVRWPNQTAHSDVLAI